MAGRRFRRYRTKEDLRLRPRKVINREIDLNVWLKFQEMCRREGVSDAWGLELTIIDQINEGRLPSPGMQLHEEREHEKFGPATPTYSGEDQQKPKDVPPATSRRPASS